LALVPFYFASHYRFGELGTTEPTDRVGCYVGVRYVIKQVRPSGELWLVRVAVHGIWGAQERACTFASRARATARAAKVCAAPDGSIEIAHFQGVVSAVVVLPNDDRSEGDAFQPDSAAPALP
jgi:hypothetical protein